MQFSVKNFDTNSSAVLRDGKNISFTGLNTGKILHLEAIKNVSHCHIGGMFRELSKKVDSNFIQRINGEDVFKKSNALVETVTYPFTKMWKGWLNSFAEKFNLENLYNKQFLVNYRKAGENEKYERALRGFLQNGDTFLNGAAKNHKIDPKDIEKLLCENGCKEPFQGLCNDVTDSFFKLFDENLAKDKAHYNTPHERAIARLVSGTTAAIILGNDFYNKSILNGKTNEEAKKSADGKRRQELIENTQEAICQYVTLGGLSEFTNTHTMAAPVISTALGILFKITSRLSTGRSLTRINVPKRMAAPLKILSMNGFLDSIQNKKPVEFEEIIPEKQPSRDDKKHILSLKNIGLFCLASIVAGFALNSSKGKKVTDNIRKSFENLIPETINQRIENFTTGKLTAGEDELNAFYDLLQDCRLADFKKYYQDYKLKNIITQDNQIYLGEYEKMTKIPIIGVEVSNKELLQIPLMPFKLMIELASYPYKIVRSALEGLKLIERAPKKQPELENKYNILNTFMDFRERLQKNNGVIDDDFIEKYEKHLQENILSALNKETQSNIDNRSMAKLTSIFGTFGSLYFATTDDFNETAKQTGDIEKANKDARLRGVNKIIRMTTQNVFLQLNNIFKVSYAKSLLGAGVITALCTVLTDSTSRILSGMPFRKMNKEELEKYNNDKKNGILKGYYNVLDKLTD